MRKLRTLVVGSVLVFTIVPFAPSAHACFSVDCIRDCVRNVASGHFVCRA